MAIRRQAAPAAAPRHLDPLLRDAPDAAALRREVERRRKLGDEPPPEPAADGRKPRR